MQIFIKMPEPYNKHMVFTIDEQYTLNDLKELINNRTCYESIKYYLSNGKSSIDEKLYNLTIKEFNKLYPDRMIENESSLTLKIKFIQ